MDATAEPTLHPPAREDLAVTWLGHATVLIELDGVRLLTDPLLRARVGPLRRVTAPVEANAARAIDAVLLSHLHADHADRRSLRVFAPSIPVIAPAGAGPWLSRCGLQNIRELEPGEEVSVGPVRVRATAANHPSGRWRERPGTAPVGFVTSASQAVYFAGDTDLFGGMSALAGSIDLALLPVGGWGPTLGPGHLDPARAAEAAEMIAPRVAVPIHWGTLAAPWPLRVRGELRAPAERFAELTARRAGDVEVRVLEPGERLEVSNGDARRGRPLDVRT